MAHILIMPRQGNTVESCVIVNWKIKEGDRVTEETIICEVETDKAAFEIPAGAAGTVLKHLCNEGDDVPVLSPIAVIGNVDENWQMVIGSEEHGSKTMENFSKYNHEDNKQNFQTSLPTHRSPVSGSQSSVSPRARNLAEKEALSVETVPGTGPAGRIIERDVQTALEQRPALTAAAKAAASEKIPAVGSGIGGRVTVEDLAQVPNPQPTVPGPCFADGAVTETHIKGIRKVISDRMLKSLSETAQYTINASASVEKLQDIRKKMRFPEYVFEEHNDMKITVNDFILFAVSRVLPRFPYMNAHKAADIIKTFERVHLGFAVDTQRGLMVPVIRNADLLSLFQISSEAKRLAAACQDGSIKPDEITGSTFSVTNLGILGITSFTPVLNIPEAAILGVCNIEMKPVVSQMEANSSNYNCRFEPHIGFSLTVNHQVIDGAAAARFLKALCEAVANIDILLAD